MLYGNISGMKRTHVDALRDLVGFESKSEFVSPAVIDLLAEISTTINREISVYITRQGRIISVGVGDSASVVLPAESKRRGKTRLSGVRVVHTHPNAPAKLSGLDLSALKKQRFDAIASVSVIDGQAREFGVAYLDGTGISETYYKSAYNIPHDELIARIEEAERTSKLDNSSTNEAMPRALLVGVGEGYDEFALAELKSLASTAELNVVGEIYQNKRDVDKAYCIGSGKLVDVKNECQLSDVDVVVFDNRLTGTQFTNLENALGVKVIDRSRLILDIFAARATTNEGKLQVKLAMLKYTLPQLLGQGKDLSRMGGGGGGGAGARRGAGETKLETDRRHIRREIFELTKKIEKLKAERDMRRSRRSDSTPTVAIVGYTNAGKSTLMNCMTKAGVLEENKLFATLDPVTRKLWLAPGKEFLLTDTVGFISRLPHEFIEAFKSTLEEAKHADLLVHVCDATSPELCEQYDVVMGVLADLGAAGKPMITVSNKCDLGRQDKILPKNTDCCHISARTGQGVDVLKQMIADKLFKGKKSKN